MRSLGMHCRIVLSNPFYYGHFRYNSEIYEGKYEPIVAKKLWDQVQEVMKRKSRPLHKQKNEPQAYCGFLFLRVIRNANHWRIQGENSKERHTTFL